MTDEVNTSYQQEIDSEWDDLMQEIDRLEARNNSILFVALDAAIESAWRTYRDRRDAALDIDDPAQIGSPDHLTLLREYEAAKKQIEAWRDSVK